MEQKNRPYAFVKGMEFVAKWEWGNKPDGGYTNHPNDPGGETKWGISKRANPDLDIKNLTLEKALDRYKERYWDIYPSLKPISCNLNNLPTALAVAVFDAGVNCGPGRAVQWLGEALETKNPTKTLNDRRGGYYMELAKQARFQVFIKGWTNRLNDLKKYCDVLEQEAQNEFAQYEKQKRKAISLAAQLKKPLK